MTVIAVEHLVPWLLSLPVQLAAEQIDVGYAHLRWASNWTPVEQLPPAADWVAEFARSLSTEHELAKGQRRATTRRATRASTRGQSASTGRKQRSKTRTRRSNSNWRLELLRGVALLAFIAALAIWGPAALKVLLPGSSKPAPTPSPVAAGQACQIEGAQATGAKGTALTCRPEGKKTLRWQPTRERLPRQAASMIGRRNRQWDEGERSPIVRGQPEAGAA